MASPRLRRSSPGSWLLFQLSSILWGSVCDGTSTTGWSSLPLGGLSSLVFRLSSNFVTSWGLSSTPRSPTSSHRRWFNIWGCHSLHLFQGFSVGGTHLTAAVNSRRVSVLRLASSELIAIATRRSFFAGSPSSWRQTEDAVPPSLPLSILGSSGSGGSSVCVDGVSSRPPVVAPSPSSLSRSVSLPGVSRPTLLVRHLRRGLGCPSRLSDRFGSVGRPPGGVVHQRQGTASCSSGSLPVPVGSTGSHGGCLLRQHHSSGLPSQGGWQQVSSPQLLGSGVLALDGIPLHSPGSTVPPGLQQRPRRRPVSPSPAPTFGVVSVPDRLSIFVKTLTGPNRFICHLRHSSLFDLLLTIPGSDVSSHGRVSPVLGRSSGLCVPSGGYHSACSHDAPGLHGDGAHPSGSTLGPVPLVLGPAPAFAGSWALYYDYSWALCYYYSRALLVWALHEVAGWDEDRVSSGDGFHVTVRLQVSICLLVHLHTPTRLPHFLCAFWND